MIQKIVVGFLITSVLSSCVTSSVILDVQRPADITVSQDIQNVVIVNRSRPSKENLTGNIVEGLISGEGIGHDRNGAEYCMEDDFFYANLTKNLVLYVQVCFVHRLNQK